MTSIGRTLVLLALLALGACGGGGGSDEDGSKLFVADGGNWAIGSMINSNPTAGTFAIDRILMGPNTGLGTCCTPSVTNLPSIALDAAGDRLYVSTQTFVRVWERAGQAEGDQPPSRSFIANDNANFLAMALDTANNRLYSADGNGTVRVYNNAMALSGNVNPTRMITPDLGTPASSFAFSIAVDLSRNLLYVGVRQPDGRIIVFNNQSTLDTTGGPAVAPSKTLTFTGGAGSFYLDTMNNRLYVAQPSGMVLVFDSASTLVSGAQTANRSFQLGALASQKYIFVDVANNRLYGVGENTVFIIPNASTADGPGVTGTVLAVQVPNAQFSAVATKP